MFLLLGLAEEPGGVGKSGPWIWNEGVRQDLNPVTIVKKKKIACPFGVKTDFSLVIALLVTT